VKVLDLFSGIGGFSLGLERAGMETVAFCEIEPYCQKVLKKHWPNVPIYDDVRTMDYDGPVDLICGGYPCQPFSTAGKREGENDDRHLWPAYLEIIRKHRPRWVIGENVAGHITLGLDQVLSDLEGEGYTWEAFVIPACAVDASHRRDRVWIIAYPNHNGSSTTKKREGTTQRGDSSKTRQEQASKFKGLRTARSNENLANPNGARCKQGNKKMEGGPPEQPDGSSVQPGETTANANSERSQGRLQDRIIGSQGREKQGERQSGECGDGGGWFRKVQWAPESSVGRVANGIPRRVDRLKCLGNAVVPQIPEIIGRAIMEIERMKP
jgi:DNA (cytosine-5)-methyltransferase 1